MRIAEILWKSKADTIKQTELATPAQSKQLSLSHSQASRAKLRYLADWCIGTVKHSEEKYVSENLFKQKCRNQVAFRKQRVQALETLTMTQNTINESTQDTSLLGGNFVKAKLHELTNVITTSIFYNLTHTFTKTFH